MVCGKSYDLIGPTVEKRIALDEERSSLLTD
jgi:hypothetical protein